MWVELAGPLRPLRIVAGDRLQFTGTVVANGPSYAALAGVTGPADIALLRSQGAHISVETTKIRVLGSINGLRRRQRASGAGPGPCRR